MPITVKPEIDKPLPDNYDDEKATTFKTKVKVATTTAKVLSDGGADIPVSSQEKVEAEELFKAFTDPEATPAANSSTTKALHTPATVQHLYAMLSDYDHQVVDEAVQLRRFITNKLIEDTGLTDPRHRLKALELLGKISDVGLFSDKTEVVIKHEDAEDLQKQIKSKLFKILGHGYTVDAEFEEVEKELGSIKHEDLDLDSDE
jgi:hypothetical protein|tara:strand:- start:1187 stop:1795 length:609 start_codon:yes stop_codon:yes gene_type:complete